jgi:hypothetical protein
MDIHHLLVVIAVIRIRFLLKMSFFYFSFIKKGFTLPNNIISSGRELWLRFNTDDSIELKGFLILYEFTPAQNSGFLYNSNIYHQNRLLGN